MQACIDSIAESGMEENVVERTTAPLPQTNRNRHFLIVDDNPDVRELVSRMVNSLGYRTTVASNAFMALECLKKDRYDVVITDYDMPAMDGCEMAEQIKARHFGISVILMTGYGEEDILRRVNGFNFIDGLLLKPFSMKSLKEKITAIR